MSEKSRFIREGQFKKTQSRLIKSVTKGIESLKSYEIKPQGVFGCEAKIICGGVTLKSSELDIEFVVRFDDDMEANEAEIIVYNLSKNTISNLAPSAVKKNNKVSIEAGYKGDTGVIFSGYITKVKTKYENADKVTTIQCIDDIEEHIITEVTYAGGTAASYILKDLLEKTGIPIDVFKTRRDWTYTEEQKVDGDLMGSIKKYSEVCGVSTYISNGKIYSRYIKEGDNLYFELSEETGLIGSPEEFEEENSLVMQEADEKAGTEKVDYSETKNGYECDSLLQHRFSAGGIVKLKSRDANGEYRICSGEHRFNPDECISHIKMY